MMYWPIFQICDHQLLKVTNHGMEEKMYWWLASWNLSVQWWQIREQHEAQLNDYPNLLSPSSFLSSDCFFFCRLALSATWLLVSYFTLGPILVPERSSRMISPAGQSQTRSSRPLFLVPFLHHFPPCFCKKMRSLMVFPERVGGVCVEYVPLCELHHCWMECTHKLRSVHHECFLLPNWLHLGHSDVDVSLRPVFYF